MLRSAILHPPPPERPWLGYPRAVGSALPEPATVGAEPASGRPPTCRVIHLLPLLAVLVLALVVRLAGIGREPLWLDEVCTHDVSAGSLAETLRAAARFDDQKPGYHLGLWAWRQPFGGSVLALRGYSTLWSVIGVGLLVLLGRELGGRRPTGLLAAVLAAVNPLDVYFAQEARMYAQAAALGTLSAWLLLVWRRRAVAPAGRPAWPLAVGYAVAAVALASSHYVAVTLLVAQGLAALTVFARARAWRHAVAYLACGGACGLALLPWLLFVGRVHGAPFNVAAVGWIPSPSLLDPLGLVTRDLVWGRAAWSPSGWRVATALSVAVLGVVVAALVRGVGPGESDRARLAGAVHATWLLLAPVALALLVSWWVMPVLFRPRFSLLVLPPFLALLALASDGLARRWARAALAAALVAMMGAATVSQAVTVEKQGLAGFAALWREEGPPDDVLFYPRWNRRVAGYYLGQPVHNVPARPQLEAALRTGQGRRVWVVRIADYSLAAEPAAERELCAWVLGLGPQRRLAAVDNVEVVEVLARPLPPVFPPLRLGQRLLFGDAAVEPHLGQGWWRAEPGFRWSRGRRAEVRFGLEEASASALELELLCFRRQRVTLTLNGHVLAGFDCAERAPHRRRFDLPPAAVGRDNTLRFDLPDATSPAAVGESGDTRTLAVGLRWLEVR